MANFTSNTYQLKREILSFSNKISKSLSKPERKFSADITYGMLASGSCLLTDVADQLHENIKKVNSGSMSILWTKKPKDYATFFNSISSFCCGVM